jgi:hypothetical protein
VVTWYLYLYFDNVEGTRGETDAPLDYRASIGALFAITLLGAVALQKLVRGRHLLIWACSFPLGLFASAGLAEAGMGWSVSRATELSPIFACIIAVAIECLLRARARAASDERPVFGSSGPVLRAPMRINDVGWGLMLVAFGIAIAIAPLLSRSLSEDFGPYALVFATPPITLGVIWIVKSIASSLARQRNASRPVAEQPLERHDERAARQSGREDA